MELMITLKVTKKNKPFPSGSRVLLFEIYS